MMRILILLAIKKFLSNEDSYIRFDYWNFDSDLSGGGNDGIGMGAIGTPMINERSKSWHWFLIIGSCDNATNVNPASFKPLKIIF